MIFTEIIDGIHISMAVDELIHHALHCQPGSQDQGCSAIMHAGIQVCGAVSYENLTRHTICYIRISYNINLPKYFDKSTISA